jgi:uncharacterized membrane-anchored protein
MAAGAPVTPESAAAEQARLDAIVASLNPRSGQIAIAAADASLQLGDDYYFLDKADSRRVLTELWGNPPSAVEGVLGMIFPKGLTPLDDTWGAVVTYTGDGYVSDEDAAEIDPDKLLTTLREGEDEDNRQRQANGFDTVHLAGWAQPPQYDAQKHNLIWAKVLKFGGNQDSTLNYDVRVLGRRGVLSLNIVAGLADLAEVGPAATALMNTAVFDAGSRYTDYQPGKDQKAAYGVAGLVAGGAALAVAKKVGFLGVLLLFLKKGAAFILVGIGAAWTWLRRKFGKGGKAPTGPHTTIAKETKPDLTPTGRSDDPDTGENQT